MAESYRAADKIKNDRRNEMLWLQGLYIYDAIGRLAPALNPMAKKGVKPEKYVEKPYPLNSKQAERNREEKAKKVFESGKRRMLGFMIEHNKKFAKKESGQNGDNG